MKSHAGEIKCVRLKVNISFGDIPNIPKAYINLYIRRYLKTKTSFRYAIYASRLLHQTNQYSSLNAYPVPLSMHRNTAPGNQSFTAHCVEPRVI